MTGWAYRKRVAHFVIQTDGEHGILLVDGEQPKLFGDLVAVDIRHNPPLDYHAIDPWPLSIRARAQPVVTVTLRLPLGPNDTLAVVEGPRVEDVHGPTADAGA